MTGLIIIVKGRKIGTRTRLNSPGPIAATKRLQGKGRVAAAT
jgi:hypothetical protein